jgi:hypothetical protein
MIFRERCWFEAIMIDPVILWLCMAMSVYLVDCSCWVVFADRAEMLDKGEGKKVVRVFCA